MRRAIAIATAAVITAAGCGFNRGTPHEQRPATVTGPSEPSPQTFALGMQLTPAGAVAQEATADVFARGSVVFLSVDVRGASAGQEIEVAWRDPSGKVLRSEERAFPKGARQYAPFSSGPTSAWRPGTYRATITINDRVVSELPFTVV